MVVGRGAPYFLRERPGRISCVSLRTARGKNPPLLLDGSTESEAEELVDTVDRESIAYVKHYFDADWPTRSLYHVMLNTAVGDDPVIQTILDIMHRVEGHPMATGYETAPVPGTH